MIYPPLIQAAGGFAGPGSITLSDSSGDAILASESGSFVVEGSFTPANGEPLDPATIVHIYIFDGSSSDNTDASRGVAAVDVDTGAFTAAVTDSPVGSSTLVLSFVLDESMTTTVGSEGGRRRGLRSTRGAGRDEARRLFAASGSRSVFTAPVANPNSCDNALAITLEWFDGDSDIDLWVTEPGGGPAVGFSNKQGVRCLCINSTVGFLRSAPTCVRGGTTLRHCVYAHNDNAGLGLARIEGIVGSSLSTHHLKSHIRPPCFCVFGYHCGVACMCLLHSALLDGDSLRILSRRRCCLVFQDVGFLDFDNTSGFGPENYVLNAALTPESEVYGTYSFRVHGWNTRDKDVSFKVVVRKEGQASDSTHT